MHGGSGQDRPTQLQLDAAREHIRSAIDHFVSGSHLLGLTAAGDLRAR
jgi:hypothetical protein